MNFKLQRENFRSKKISAEEATKTAIDKVKKDNLNIFINHFEEEAIIKAKHIDNNFDKFKDLPLSGVPIDNTLDELVSKGYTVRYYIPYGPDWYQYSLRRIRENPDIWKDTLKAFFFKSKHRT